MSESLENSGGKPNLTPILDMVFQLITFFMLVCNFKMNEVDKDVKLPVVGTAKTVENNPEGTLVLNIKFPKDAKGVRANKPALFQYGKRYEFSDKAGKWGPAEEHILAQESSYRLRQKAGEDEKLGAMVIIRADQRVPYYYLNQAITACQEANFQQFAFKAMGDAKAQGKPKR